MLQKIASYVWEGRRKYYLIAALVALGLMIAFGENTEWIAE